MMKRISIVFVCFLMAMLLCLSGCGSKSDNGASSTTSTASGTDSDTSTDSSSSSSSDSETVQMGRIVSIDEDKNEITISTMQGLSGSFSFDTSNIPTNGSFDASNLPEGFDSSNLPEGFDSSNIPANGMMPGGFGGGNFDATNMPENFEASQTPEGFYESQMPEEFDASQMPQGFDASQVPQNSDGTFHEIPDGSEYTFDPAQFAGEEVTYKVSKKTTISDESGNKVSLSGLYVNGYVQYTADGDSLVSISLLDSSVFSSMAQS